ncbi:flagellar hook protein FlgE [Geodermatophilus ruber]|uniref:Flagellar hook protein FlgE n=1 Tax=Geodermatophilus ruber TaxID=504800 RepID=A0A1I4FYD8_9ACTN|nr:flagellar hook protein FlgE [Geodermatophilus ruber]SFL22942.1 flagellar hook protein FlgE [Geodermatophilus ruber]
MLRSMFSAISGLRAHQTKMDVTGNNIANVNTVGYKSQQTVFEDTLSQVLRTGGAPAAERGGTNPAQVGLGVKLAGITTNWTQGATQNTGRSTDFMIEGDGFFVVESGGQQLYTRSGSFSFDAAGNLATNSGALLQGWSVDPATGVVNPNGPVGNLTIPYGQVTEPKGTGGAAPIIGGKVEGNLFAGATAPNGSTPGTKVETSITMYDDLGNEIPVTYTFEKTANANEWSLQITRPGPGTPPTTVPLLPATTVTFDGAGKLSAVGGTAGASTVPFTPPAGSGWTGPVTVDLSGMTQYGSASSATATEQNGYGAGTLQSFSLGNDGTVTGIFSNGERKTLGQLALASFDNPSGLEKAGSSTYRVGNNSGLAMVGQPGVAGRGVLSAGALEMSNVDLAEEFTGLIVAQRGFQANSRVITSSDEILQDLVNLKR